MTAASLEQRFKTQVQPLFQQHCYRCHGNGKHKGDLSLDAYQTLVSVQADRKTWLHLADELNQKLMPPEERPQPKAEEYATILNWIGDALSFCDCSGPRNPGRIAIHRLNRTEYNNTIRDLLGVDFNPAEDFPADDSGYGFDNIADVLSMSPLLAEKYLSAAEQALDKALPSENPYANKRKRYDDEKLDSTGDGNTGGSLNVNGEAFVSHEFVCDATYEFRIQAGQDKFGDEAAKMVLKLDGDELKTYEVQALRNRPRIFTLRTQVKAGKRRVAVEYPNNAKDPNNPDPKKRGDRNLHLNYLEIAGPFDAPPAPESEGHKRVFVATPGNGTSEDMAARKVIEHFATRAFRRPATGEEVASLFKLYRGARADGDAFEPAVKLSLSAVLCSPHFLYRIELDPPDAKPGTVHPISNYELATRLGYFLWSSTPDEQLVTLAKSGTLHHPDILTAQVRRMLLDPKANALVTNFAGQWLEIRLLDDWKPDPAKFPSWNDRLRADMKRETELFVQSMIREDRSVLDLLSADYSFMNERLAKHYGIRDVKGDDFRKVSLAGTHRGGVLTQASVLTVTAMPTRTSPVKRGKFLLEQVLGTPPPPPPADVPALSEKPQDVNGASLRKRLEIHRESPNCAVCHNRLDPLGFAMENFDAVGRWRTKDGSFEIDPNGKLPDGTPLDGPDTLRKVLLAKKSDFVQCLSEKLLTYALGRGMEYYDQCTVKDVVRACEQDGYKFSAMANAIVQSDAFRKRRIPTEDELKAATPAKAAEKKATKDKKDDE